MNHNYPINLQFFAQEKTEKATPKKRAEARKKGQVAKSAEVNTAFIFLFVFILLFFLGTWMGTKLLSIYRISLQEYLYWDLSVHNIQTLFTQVTLEAASIVSPIMAIALVAGVLSNYIQIGFLFSTEPLKMKLERLNPLTGFKRIFSLRAIVELIKSLLKISIIGSVAFILLWMRLDEIILLSQKEVTNSLAVISKLIWQMGLAVSLIFIFLAILDYMYQKYDYEKNLRMSKQEIKDEHKKTEGDPLIKSKIRQRQREMAMRRMMQEIPHADVVITNPTHYAVALKYEAEEMDAPIVVAKGADYLALKIRDIARNHDIIIVENKPLARTLYQRTEIGDEVPEDLFATVAEVLAYVYRVQGKV